VFTLGGDDVTLKSTKQNCGRNDNPTKPKFDLIEVDDLMM